MPNPFSPRRIVPFLLVSALLFSLLPLTAALSLRESRAGIWGEVVDVDGNPVPGLVFSLVPIIDPDSPVKVKTGKKGRFQFPRVEFIAEGYRIALESEVYFIREFRVKVRRMNKDIWQDDQGKLIPEAQDGLPKIKYRGGNCTLDFKVAKIAEFSAARASFEAKQEKQAAAKAEAQKKRDMTPTEMAEDALAYGDYKFAAEKFAEASAADPENVDLLWSWADATGSSGDSGAALRLAQKVLTKDPKRKGVRTKMALWMEEGGQLADAVPLIEEEKVLDPENPSVAKMLMTAYGTAGQKEKADAATEEWVRLAPENPQALLALASVKAEQKNFVAAEALFTKIAGMDPEGAHKMFYNAGASILKKKGRVTKGDRERAVRAFEKACELKPDYTKAHLLAGDAYVGLGDFTKARSHYEAFVKYAAADDANLGKVKSMLGALPK